MSTYVSTQSSEQTLQDMMIQYCDWPSVYPDMKKLREVLTHLSDQQKLHILQQECRGWTPLFCAAYRDHREMISTLLTSLLVFSKQTQITDGEWVHTSTKSSILRSHGVNEEDTGLSNSWSADTAHICTASRWDSYSVCMDLGTNMHSENAKRISTESRQSDEGKLQWVKNSNPPCQYMCQSLSSVIVYVCRSFFLEWKKAW